MYGQTRTHPADFERQVPSGQASAKLRPCLVPSCRLPSCASNLWKPFRQDGSGGGGCLVLSLLSPVSPT